ncbi:MAG TPA: DMP19 family protein [Gemmatimonadaceae bacterium]|nr:DMP19 family protein [Gemmatimonadaceae bacterium]
MKDLRIDREAVGNTRPDDLVWRVIEPAYEAVSIHDGPEVLDSQLASLTRGQRALLALHWTVAEVCNGGFDQYFINPTGDLAEEARAGFERIGAKGTVRLLDKVFTAFPGGPPPRDSERRAEMLDALDEDEREKLFQVFDDEFYDLMDSELYGSAYAYIQAHPHEFFRDEPGAS